LHIRLVRRAALVLLLALALLPAPAASAQAEGPLYIVEAGDTLSAIARTFGVSVEALAAANGISDPSTIFPGQQLVIPGYPGVSGVLRTLEIGYGDTLRSMALRQGVRQQTLARLNRVVNSYWLYVGQPLIVPERGDAPPAVPQSTGIRVADGQGMLELAALSGLNSWDLQTRNRLGYRLWALPEERMFLPGGPAATQALPLGVEQVALKPVPVAQGHTLEVRLQLSRTLWVEAALGTRQLRLVSSAEDELIALQGVHALAQPGLEDLAIRVYDVRGGPLLDEFIQPVPIRAGDFGLEALRVPPETLDPANTGPEDALVESVTAETRPEKLWDGLFQFPTTYYETFPSVFGTRRSYNGSDYTYYHTGLDLYGSTQTEVLAPARGVVVFADFLTVRGNVTFIDHGWGVFSGFLHQSQLLVQPGEMVEPGQLIGYVGATGRVTGPHLHWEVWVGGVPVDPREWTASVFP
jgi:murein DD-endopeptidase MepM/ murein hydrolase activator NlpD